MKTLASRIAPQDGRRKPGWVPPKPINQLTHANRAVIARDQDVTHRLHLAWRDALNAFDKQRVRNAIRECERAHDREAKALQILSQCMNEYFPGKRWIAAGAYYHALVGNTRTLTIAMSTTTPRLNNRRIIDLEPIR